MPPTYEKSFGLTDNPFSPKKLLPGVKSALMMREIYIKPLRLDDDDGLFQLYVGDAGPFDQVHGAYRTRLEGEGYAEGAAGGQSSVGLNSFIFFIHGPIGTGKTTLMNMMLRSLKRCKPPNGAWAPFRAQFNLMPNESQQNKELDVVKDKIEKGAQAGDYCYLVLDNLTDGAVEKAFDLYNYIGERFQLLMFVTTSDSELRQKTWANWPLPIVLYETAELSPDNAVSFIRSRVNLFRDPKTAQALGNHELFPFNEKNIRAAVTAKSVAYDAGTKIITIRQFSQALSSILERGLPRSHNLFNGAAAAPTPAQLDGAEIDLIVGSKEIIEKVAA